MRISEYKALLGAGAGRAVPPPPPSPLRDAGYSVYDAPQVALGFAISQGSYIEREVNRVMYPDIQYPRLIPVDTSAPEWTPAVTYFSSDMTGKADWLSTYGSDVPNADIKRDVHKTQVHMAGVGYEWGLEELGQAQLLGMSLPAEKAMSARRAYEEFVDSIALRGDTRVGFAGLINNALITPANVPNDGTGSSRLFSNKTVDKILRDLNEPLSSTHTVSKTNEVADTMLLPWDTMHQLSTMERSSGSDMTVLEYFRKNNVYTLTTGQPIMLLGVRGLETAGDSATKRLVTYRRAPEVLKLHIPMPHRFLQPWQKSATVIDVPGIFRLGGLDIRRPGAVRYRDGF